MTSVFLNQIATAVPPFDIHQHFVDYAVSHVKDKKTSLLLKRMVKRCQIEHRYSFLAPHTDIKHMDKKNFYTPNNFPTTQQRMQRYKHDVMSLVAKAIDQLTFDPTQITHLIITTCTGFYAPGVDIDIIKKYKLAPHVERMIIGFMGCYAAVNAMKASWHIIRSMPTAKILVVNVELCTLHLQETQDIEKLLSFLIFSDGCAASIISAEPVGIELQSFHSVLIPKTDNQITWHIGNEGFDMVLSGKVPSSISLKLPDAILSILNKYAIEDITHWAIHPGGRSILDAVKNSLGLSESLLAASRETLRQYGNMSSATLPFVLKTLMGKAAGPGCALAFGPGIMLEGMTFNVD